jgi:DNA-directed RNA polymerase subunit RPC12/RpoP
LIEVLRWLIPLLLVVAIFVVGVRAFLSSSRSGEPLICTACGAQTDMPQSKTRGSFVVEIVLWLALVIPGLLYSLWRQSTRQKVCPTCGSATLILANTPDGRKRAEQFSKGKS